MKLLYPAIFKPLSQIASGYCVVFPDLAGCVTQGDSLENAMEMAIDAASGWILTSIEDGEDIPNPSHHSNIITETPEEFINYISLDMEEYAKQYSEKAVKKTLTIPKWLDYMAEKVGINFSQTLQRALKEQLKLTPDAQSNISTVSNKTIELVDELKKIVPTINNILSSAFNSISSSTERMETISEKQYFIGYVDVSAINQFQGEQF